MDIIHERESTLKVPIDRELFSKVYNLISGPVDECTCVAVVSQIQCKKCTTGINSDDREYAVRESVILVFNDNTRLASSVYRSKRVESRTYVAVFVTGKFYRILRTHAIEKLEPLPKTVRDAPKTVRSVYRIIITKKNIENRADVSIRLTFNKEEDVTHGTFYNIACETEYSMLATYREIVEFERIMIREYSDFIHLTEIPMNAQTLNDMSTCVVPKVQVWSCLIRTCRINGHTNGMGSKRNLW